MSYIRFDQKGQNHPIDILDCLKLTPTCHITIKQYKLSITFIFCFVGQHGAMNCVTNSVDPVRKTVFTCVSSNDLQMNPPVFQNFRGLGITQYASNISEGNMRQNYLQNIPKLFENGG